MTSYRQEIISKLNGFLELLNFFFLAFYGLFKSTAFLKRKRRIHNHQIALPEKRII